MAELPPLPELGPDVRKFARQLRQGHSLDDNLGYLDFALSGCAHPEVYAPLFLPALAEAFDRADQDLAEPFRLGYVLRRLGPNSVRLARHRKAAVRLAVAEAVQRMGERTVETRRAKSLPEATAVAFGPAAAEVAEAMTLLLADPDPGVRAQACVALPWASPTRASARRLAQCLKDPSEDVVHGALEGLARLGPEAVEERPRVLQFLDHKRYHRSGVFRQALRALASPPVEASLLDHLRPLVKLDWAKLCADSLQACLELHTLCAVLKKLGPAARDCVPDLEPLLRHDDEVIGVIEKLYVAMALLHIDGGNALARDTLERIAASDDETYREFVVEHLYGAPVALQVQFRGLIEKLAGDPHERVQTSAQELLAKLKGREE